MFSNPNKYEEFRAKIKIWLPSLDTLDGTDFSKDSATIAKHMNAIEQLKAKVMAKHTPAQGGQLATIPEKGNAGQDVDDLLKRGKAGASGKTTEYKFNQRAYKKYHSTRSLVDRILKSHSEGNRFIRNEDLWLHLHLIFITQ